MHLAIETRLPLSLRGVALAALLVGALVITPGVALADETRHVGGGQQAGTVGDDDAASLAADPESDGSAATTAAPGGANTTSRSDARGPTATAGGPSGSAAGASGGWTTDPKEIIGWVVDSLTDALGNLVNRLLRSMVEPIVGTPTPEGSDGWLVFGTPTNAPWTALYDELYEPFVLPLAAGLLFVALAYVGLRSGGLTAGRRRRLLRRIAIAWLVVFVWFPIASAALHLFDAIGVVIATGGNGPPGEIVRSLGDVPKSLLVGSVHC